MKIKSVLAAFIAAAAISCTSVCALAEDNALADEQVTETTNEDVASSVPENVTVAADPLEGNPISGVDGAAALAGIVLVGGAALVISHKRG